ncbi:type II toxin-antitoxin system HigB family toxin [Nostoc edaphicum CCNP1411]|uniref:Type II toxin-antitoxin system HigB family toxin n=1 Tax=Nostoc edaphicum CCNP1411 TaxID=1472755 RepID=A0A7D7L8W5_9NOSO|nr:type II toxin-antitoxin system HigB family toxin [Nostoc edaphicum]QMS87076.1 type II toxin-antitoxin system HigB family toxin [Nostoc edaphicum CCNP1411]
MHIISRARLSEFWEKHSNAQTSLRLWYKLTSVAEWQNLVELRQTFPSADQVGNFTVFNISGNNYRLITLVDYKFQKVFIRHILTHAEYDKDDWKNDYWFT